jgi:thiamine-phosphate pyrophosphorylase
MREVARGERPGLQVPALMLITDRLLARGEDALVEAVREAVAGGVNAVQLREKDMPPGDLLALAMRLRDVTSERAAFLVNGSLEVALAAGADGLHLPEDASMVERPERPFVIGRSVHSRAAAERAWADCSDYLIAGPIYETTSHGGMTPAGPKQIEDIAHAVAVPVLAVGGITPVRVEEVMRTGASGVAVISAVLGAKSPRAAARELREAIDSAWDE